MVDFFGKFNNKNDRHPYKEHCFAVVMAMTLVLKVIWK